jgi:hypothetical protein
MIKGQIVSTAVVFALLILGQSSAARAQNVDTRIPDVYYIVRDNKGKIVDMSSPGAPLLLDSNGAWVAAASRANEFDLGGGVKVKATALLSKGYRGRSRLEAVTLKYRGKTMRLIFDLEIPRVGASFEVDSLPFQEGTFKLDLGQRQYRPLSDWPFFPATAWKKISNRS